MKPNLILLLLTSVSNITYAETTKPTLDVPLSFNWPEQASAHVQFYRKKTEHSALGSRYIQEINGSYKITSSSKGTLRVIRKDAVNMGVEKDPELWRLQPAENRTMEFLNQISQLSPPFVVSQSGRIEELIELESYKSRLIKAANE